MKTVKTVMKENEKNLIFITPFPSNLYDKTKLTIEIMGQIPERSFEDRSVYINFKMENSKNNIQTEGLNSSMWIQGEEAISLGMKLIESGNFAMKANMYNHQLFRMKKQLELYITEGRVKEVVFELIEEKPVNYGEGYHLFLITPVFHKGKEPEYVKDFCFEEVVYWSPFKKEFEEQMYSFVKNISFRFKNYDHNKKIEEFKDSCKQKQ